MKLKNFTKMIALAVVATTSAMFTGCSSDDEPFANYDGNGSVLTRSGDVATTSETTIGFENYANMGISLAGPTSYGANLYASYSGSDKFTEGNIVFGDNNILSFGLNEIDGALNFWNGGIALSNWAIRDNTSTTQAEDWWYSYNNQCSVYNTKARGNNKGAGAGKSDVFAIVYGYQDEYNSSYMSLPKMTFDNPVTVKSLEYCNSSYVYGVLENGNQFGDSIIVTVPVLKKEEGYFKVMLSFYDKNEKLITERTKYLANYQKGEVEVNPVAEWTLWDFAQDGGAVQNVKTIKINFDGSDQSAWGLNTPAYICLDNIKVSY